MARLVSLFRFWIRILELLDDRFLVLWNLKLFSRLVGHHGLDLSNVLVHDQVDVFEVLVARVAVDVRTIYIALIILLRHQYLYNRV